MVASFAWLDGMSVGVDEFDDAHKSFFTMLNRIAEALERGDAAQAEATCGEFLRLAVAHGEREAEFLRRNRYPGMALIEESQAGTQARIAALMEAIRGEPERARALVAEMRTAVVTYLLRGDINFKSFVDHLGTEARLLDEDGRPTPLAGAGSA